MSKTKARAKKASRAPPMVEGRFPTFEEHGAEGAARQDCRRFETNGRRDASKSDKPRRFAQHVAQAKVCKEALSCERHARAD